jgi:hypothetical protein
VNKHPGETIAYLTWRSMFQTQKRIGHQDPAQPGRGAPPDMVWYTLYGTKGFVENGRVGWGETTGYLFLERDAEGIPAPRRRMEHG